MSEATLPVRLTPEERRNLAKRLAERLGTKVANSVSILVSEVERREDFVRLELRAETGEVKVRGAQEVAGSAFVAADGDAYRIAQRDEVEVSGLPDGLAIVLRVEEAVELAARPAAPLDDPGASHPLHVRVEVRDGGSGEAEKAALAEAYRLAGERFAAGLLKGGSKVVAIPGGPALEADEIGRWLRGPWHPLETAVPQGLGRFAAVHDPARSGKALVVREAFAPPPDLKPVPAGLRGLLASARGIAPVFQLEPTSSPMLLAGARHEREEEKAVDGRGLEKALAALADELGAGAPADPRPLGKPVDVFLADAQTPGRRLGGPRRLRGSFREASTVSHARETVRLAALDLDVIEEPGSIATPGVLVVGGAPLPRRLVERHLVGLPGGALATASALEGDIVVLVLAPADDARKWLEHLRRALPY